MFTINGISWQIKLVSSNHPALKRSDGSWSIGACDNIMRTIYIDIHLQDDQLKKVICHEVTHAAMFSYHVNLTIDQEELLADLIATYGSEIIYITNKIFLKMIQK